jgi:2-polyprenyl-3-methyl-5-hydroxy-6-metoxy-1,4-benzoquinol methylase
MIALLRSTEPPIEYAQDYFFAFYKRQYGKTYIEDFPGLKETGKKRLRHIIAALENGKGRGGASINGGKPLLLDIGCAYGPFLAAAAEMGLSPLGIDPAEDAVRYVRETLKIDAVRGFFPDPSIGEIQGEGRFDAVTLWYVIEHFRSPAAALAEISRILKPGGVLAFSTPSFGGISGRKNLRAFLEQSPTDHWTVWSPRQCGKLLAYYGFELKRIVVSGHHPERFPGFRGLAGKKHSPVYGLLYTISRIFGLGDTFEVYAVRTDKKTGV